MLEHIFVLLRPLTNGVSLRPRPPYLGRSQICRAGNHLKCLLHVFYTLQNVAQIDVIYELNMSYEYWMVLKPFKKVRIREVFMQFNLFIICLLCKLVFYGCDTVQHVVSTVSICFFHPTFKIFYILLLYHL